MCIRDRLRAGIETIKLYGETKVVRADIEVMESFSAHADRGEMIDFIANQKKSLKKLFLVHGVENRQKKFRATLSDHGFKKVEIPELGQVFKL